MDGKNVAIINTSEINLNKKSLTCGFTGIDRNARKGTARITFQSDIADRTVRVFGLPRPNVLYEYLSGNTWTTIYEYTANETINMGCALNVVANGNYKFVWNFKGKDLGEYYYTNDLEAIKYSTENFTRTLSGIDDETVIKCIAYEQPSFYKVTEVKLQLKYESNTENLEIEMNKYGSIALILLYLAVCAIFIAILIYSLIFWCRRAKLARLLNNSYNHISDHDASPIPTFPTQWDDNDHYTKIDEDVTQENYSYANNDELLKYPNLRQSHAPSENHYTEIDEYFKAPVKLANKNINQVIHITKNRSKANKENNANENTYDKLMRNGNLKKLNTEKVMVNESLDVKNNDGHQHNYKNINSITNINDSAYAYAYDTRPTAAKSPNRDRSALDYDVPYGTCEVNEENGCYVGPDT
ncbi:unnamed protein product [Spodoptera exigua]|nr:unnamed protein product [Spodoptera exigua]